MAKRKKRCAPAGYLIRRDDQPKQSRRERVGTMSDTKTAEQTRLQSQTAQAVKEWERMESTVTKQIRESEKVLAKEQRNLK